MKLMKLIPVSILAAAAASYKVFSQDSDADKCVGFLLGYGWELVNEPRSSSDVNIPAVFDEVYKSYNTMQLEAGLDLTPYAGMSGTRYTFLITNYPVGAGENVYADIICVNGEPIAGDIMTVSVNGFMHSLKRNDQ